MADLPLAWRGADYRLAQARDRLCRRCRWHCKVWTDAGLAIACNKRLSPLTATGEDCPYWMAPLPTDRMEQEVRP